jgi:DNA primase
MAFPPRFLDEIRSRLSLAEVVGRRVKLIRRGREFVGLCPFHHEKTPSFAVVEEKGFYHCFGCGAHGDAIGFTMRAEGLPFPEAVERLAQQAGLPLPERDAGAEEQARQAKSLYDANEAAAEWFAAQLYTQDGRSGLDYLKRRGLADDTIARFRLGYAPLSRDALRRALIVKGFDEAQLIEAGLLVKPEDERGAYDRFRGRVMFPIADKRGRIIAFGGRVLGDEKPKYLNSPETPLFQKGRILYAYREARAAAHKGAEVLVAEGYMDVIALHQAGFDGAVAPLGTALTETQIEEIWKLKPEPILCFDGDEAGRRAAARAAERVLPILKPGHSLRFLFLPEGEDPDSLIHDGGIEALRSLLEQAVPLVDWLWQIETAGRHLDTPERRAALRKSLLDRTAAIAERSLQDLYAQEFKERLGRLFAPPPDAMRERRGGRSTPWRGSGKGVGAAPLPRSAMLRSDGNTGRVRIRAHQALIAAIIQNPEIINDLTESLAALPMPPGSPLDRLRVAILNTVGGPPLDTDALRNHLAQLGFSEALKGVLSADVCAMFPFARPKAQREEASAAWRVLFADLVERPAIEKELLAAERDLAEDMSPRNQLRLSAIKEQAGLRHDPVTDLSTDTTVSFHRHGQDT